MTTAAPTLSAREAVAGLRDVVDGLLAADLTGFEAAEFLSVVDELERQSRRLAAVDARVLAELKGRYLAGLRRRPPGINPGGLDRGGCWVRTNVG